jgi:hypothetical protein
MPRRLRALIRQALTVHVPDPADSWRSLYDAEGPASTNPGGTTPGVRTRPLLGRRRCT